MSLQPAATTKIDRTTTTPFLLRLFWRTHRLYSPDEFSIAPPHDTSHIPDYASLLPAAIRQQSVQIYTWPTCTLAELTGLLSSVLPDGILNGNGNGGGVGTRLVFKLIFPDTRGGVSESGRGKWVDKPLGSVVIGAGATTTATTGTDADDGEGEEAGGGVDSDTLKDNLEGDAEKTLADARFVIGDYIACTIYPPTADGRVAPAPPLSSARGPRDPYLGPSRGAGGGLPPPPRENGYRSRGGSRGRGGGGGFGAAPPPGDWRRGERPPGYGGGGGGGGYRGRGGGGRPY